MKLVRRLSLALAVLALAFHSVTCVGRHVEGVAYPQRTVWIENEGSTSAWFYYEDGDFLGRVSGLSERCLPLKDGRHRLVVKRADGVWITPDLDTAEGSWGLVLDNYPGWVAQRLARTTLPRRSCK